MKKLILYILLLTSTFVLGQIKATLLDSIPTSKIIDYSSGSVNPNVFIPASSSDFTSPDSGNANKIWEVRTDIDLSGGSFNPPANITIFLNGGNVLNVGSFVGNSTSFKFLNESSVFDISGASVTGTFEGDVFYFSNLGGIDDGSTDNKPALREALKLVNSASGTLIWNKISTGIAKMSSTDISGVKPFFPSTYADLPYIGNGNDGVTLIINADIEVQEIADNLQEKTLIQFYNTNYSKIINNGIITGDRDIHDYVTRYKLTQAPTTGTYIDFKLLVIDPRKDNVVLTTIDENIPITAGASLATVQNEVLTYINTNAAFSDYTASASSTTTNYFDVHAPAGQYFRLVVDEGDTDLTYVELNDANQPHENGSLITWGSNSNYCDLINGKVQKATGEAVRATFQGNGAAAITNFTRGDLDFTTGVFTASGTGAYMLMDEHRDVSSYVHPWFYVGYNAFGAVTSLYPTFWIMWEDASNNFIEMSPLLEMHRRVPVEDGHIKARIVLDYTPNSQYMFMDAKSMPLGGICKNVEFYNNRRQHVSNPPPDMWFIGCTFDKVGGFSPNHEVDWEDHGKYSTDGGVTKCTFKDAASGSLILKGNEGLKIVDNVWEAKTNNIYSKGAISTAWGRKVNIEGNTLTRRDVTLDISTIFTNNHMTDGILTVGAGGSMISINDFTDVLIRDNLDSSAPATNSSGGPTTSIISNQLFKYTKNWSKTGVYTLLREYATIGYENVTFKFNDKSSMHYSDGITFPLVTLSNSVIGNNWHARKTVTDTEACQGYYKNVKVLDIAPTSSGLHNAAVELYASNKIDGFDCSTNVTIAYGYVVDGIHYKDITANGWLKLTLDQYASTGSGTFPTIYIDNPQVTVPAETDSTHGYLNNTSQGGNEWTTVFRTPAKDVNIVVNGGKFESLGDVTGYFGKFEQYGTLTFKGTDCISKAATLETLDLTNTTFVPATTGAITFIDPPTFENFMVILRSQDHVVFTEASPLMATYATFADEAAATAAGYPSGYMYVTPTGDPKMKL